MNACPAEPGETWRPTDKTRRRGGVAGGPWPSPANRNERPANQLTSAPRYCNLCRGRCSHRPGDLAAAQTSRAGQIPPLRINFMFWANRESRRAPDGRRAGRPHPADPCGGANIPILKSPRCGGRERPPYETGGNRAANRKSAAAQGVCGRAMALPCKP